ncbi:hypothetical protein FRC07_002439 [Ceratobasidium sp. 392]|nr:hypothetical protein FRC07_002439 [Ceratobasidium sp. 392]
MKLEEPSTPSLQHDPHDAYSPTERGDHTAVGGASFEENLHEPKFAVIEEDRKPGEDETDRMLVSSNTRRARALMHRYPNCRNVGEARRAQEEETRASQAQRIADRQLRRVTRIQEEAERRRQREERIRILPLGRRPFGAHTDRLTNFAAREWDLRYFTNQEFGGAAAAAVVRLRQEKADAEIMQARARENLAGAKVGLKIARATFDAAEANWTAKKGDEAADGPAKVAYMAAYAGAGLARKLGERAASEAARQAEAAAELVAGVTLRVREETIVLFEGARERVTKAKTKNDKINRRVMKACEDYERKSEEKRQMVAAREAERVAQRAARQEERAADESAARGKKARRGAGTALAKPRHSPYGR